MSMHVLAERPSHLTADDLARHYIKHMGWSSHMPFICFYMRWLQSKVGAHNITAERLRSPVHVYDSVNGFLVQWGIDYAATHQ